MMKLITSKKIRRIEECLGEILFTATHQVQRNSGFEKIREIVQEIAFDLNGKESLANTVNCLAELELEAIITRIKPGGE